MYDTILVPVDGSNASNRGLDEAIKLAAALGSRLHLLHVVNELVLIGSEQGYYDYAAIIDSLREQGKRVLENALALARSHCLEPNIYLNESLGARAADVIVQQATSLEAQLIIMGTHGRSGLRRLALGSDAEMVARHVLVPVLLVRAPEVP